MDGAHREVGAGSPYAGWAGDPRSLVLVTGYAANQDADRLPVVPDQRPRRASR